ncbi:hypothetical protein BN946_scf184977.g127 [Trametes cinnabarina]|uniref:Uncharacterized protein n=1 Tax=Pycnoporus cinnabarinus TaxID=5643 RepID=A0A060SD47_PYCCI|nr:hypothetical protein BN946_scf184977.g127 [Trametes cinnabarina]
MSDDYFDDDLDSAFLNEVDAIEAAHAHPPPLAAAGPATSVPSSSSTSKFKPPTGSRQADGRGAMCMLKPHYSAKPAAMNKTAAAHRPSPSDVIEIESSDYDDVFDDVLVDEAALANIDKLCEQELKNLRRGTGHPSAQPIAGPSTERGLVRRASKQLNLFGDVAVENEPAKLPHSTRQPFQRSRSRQMPLAGQAKKTKQWDRTAYAKTGWRKPKKNPDKGKGRASDDEHEEEHIEFEQFPAPQIPIG